MMSWGSAVEKAFSSCGQLNLLKTYLYFDIKVSFVGPDSGIICCFQASLVTVNHFFVTRRQRQKAFSDSRTFVCVC